MCLSKVKILIAKVLFVISALGTVIIVPVTVYGTGDSSRHKAVELFNTPLVINEKRTFEQFKKQLGDNRPKPYLTKVANFFNRKKTQGQNEFPLEELNVKFISSKFYDDIAPDEPYVDIEKTKKNHEITTDGQQPIVPVANVPQQAGLEGVGVGIILPHFYFLIMYNNKEKTETELEGYQYTCMYHKIICKYI